MFSLEPSRKKRRVISDHSAMDLEPDSPRLDPNIYSILESLIRHEYGLFIMERDDRNVASVTQSVLFDLNKFLELLKQHDHYLIKCKPYMKTGSSDFQARCIYSLILQYNHYLSKQKEKNVTTEKHPIYQVMYQCNFYLSSKPIDQWFDHFLSLIPEYSLPMCLD